MNIKYGLIIPPQLNLETGQLVIDIDLYKQENIVTGELISTSELINSEIFNIFSWLINKNTKKMLDEYIELIHTERSLEENISFSKEVFNQTRVDNHLFC